MTRMPAGIYRGLATERPNPRAKDLDLDVDMNTSQVRQLAQDLGGGEEPLVRRVIRDEK